MGATVRFVGAVGRDGAGELLLEHLVGHGVDITHVTTVDGPSGVAYVLVDDSAENMIVVAAGANGAVAPMPEGSDEWLNCAVLLMQLELPIATVLKAAQEARARGVRVVVNAAPVAPLPDELLACIDVLIVNEHECRELAGRSVTDDAARLLAGVVSTVVVTLGATGAAWYEREAKRGQVAPPTVEPVDTTGAGDAFCGVFAARLASGATVADAVRHAVVAGALSTEVSGAAESAPTLDAVQQLLT
jgi:ribokinase